MIYTQFYVGVLVVFSPPKEAGKHTGRDGRGAEGSARAVRAPPSRRRAGLSGGTARLTAPRIRPPLTHGRLGDPRGCAAARPKAELREEGASGRH